MKEAPSKSRPPEWLGGDAFSLVFAPLALSPGVSQTPYRVLDLLLEDRVDTFVPELGTETCFFRGKPLLLQGTSSEIRRKLQDLGARLGERPIGFIGGDHSITPEILRSWSGPVLFLDAHLDLRPDLGGPAAAAWPVRERAIFFGTRACSIDEASATFFPAADGVEPVLAWLGGVSEVYLSLDVDVFPWDSNWPEPGELPWRDFVRLLRVIRGKLIGFDVVEARPSAAYRVAALIPKLVACFRDFPGRKV